VGVCDTQAFNKV